MKDFDNWNINKKELNKLNVKQNFSEREVWFLKMGVNIGYEQDGNGNEYLRPVIVLKKFNKKIFLGIPLTKIKKDLPFYYNFKFKNKDSSAILSQVKLFDAKRLKFRSGKLSVSNYKKIKEKLIELIQ